MANINPLEEYNMVFSFLNKFGAAYLTARDRKDSVIEARQRGNSR